MPPRCMTWLPSGDAELAEKPPADRAGGDARRRLAGRGALEDVAGIVAIVLEHAGEIGVAGRGARDGALARRGIALARRGIHDLLPVLPVAIVDRASRSASRASRRRARRRGTRPRPSRSACAGRGRSPAAGARARRRRQRRGAARPAGIPSRMETSAGPCDSPAVVKRSMSEDARKRRRRRGSMDKARPPVADRDGRSEKLTTRVRLVTSRPPAAQLSP